jgi:hypothetical protein
MLRRHTVFALILSYRFALRRSKLQKGKIILDRSFFLFYPFDNPNHFD